MATVVQLGIQGYSQDVGFPQVVIEDREDARTFVAILSRNGVPVNLREAPR